MKIAKKMEKMAILGGLAGYAAASEVIEKERAERLANLTPEQALEMARDLEASWERQPAPCGVQRSQC